MTADVWLKRYYELCDAKDIDGCMELWAPDGSLRFGNAEPVFGAHAIRAACTELMNSVATTTHSLLNVWEMPDGLIIFEAGVDFVRLDGGEASVTGLAICRVEGERFLDQRTFVDLTPVFAPVTSSQSRSRR